MQVQLNRKYVSLHYEHRHHLINHIYEVLNYKFLHGLLVSVLRKENSTYDFWYDWVTEKPVITDQVAIERYINDNTNTSLELRDEKKERDAEMSNNDNEKEHKRYYVMRQFVAETMLTPINVGIFEIDGDNIKKMGYETKSAGQLLVMSYAGRYSPDCKTKLG